jgi:hypothetical protein
MMRRKEWSGAVKSGLHFIQHEQSAIAPAQGLRLFQVFTVGDTHSGLNLYRLHDESSKAFGRKLGRKLLRCAKGDHLDVRKHRTESILPERIRHERECSASESMEGALGRKHRDATGMGPGEFDRCLDSLAAGTGEERFGELSSGQLAELRA